MRRNNIPTNYFDQIYHAALKQDPTLLPKGKYCIDEFKQGTYGISAAAQLASEGKKDAVKWILKQGANINWVALGAAMAGDQVWAKELMDQGADILWVACGAAQGGHDDWVIKLTKQGANLDEVAHHAALGGHKNLAMELIQKGATRVSVRSGARMRGDENWVKDLIKRRNTPRNIKTSSDFKWLDTHAALIGHRELALTLVKKRINRNIVAYAAAEGGHRNLVFEILSKDDDIGIVAIGAAKGGHRELALEFVSKGADKTSTARQAIESRHWAIAYELINSGANINEIACFAAAEKQWSFVFELIEKSADISLIAEGARFAITTNDQQLWLLSHFNNAQKRSQFIEALKTTTIPVHIKPTIIKRANRIRQLMQVYGYDYQRALMSTSTAQPHGALATLAGLVGCQQSVLHQLPFAYEIWLKIFESVFDSKISSEQFDQLGFLTIRLLLIHQLKNCDSGPQDQLISLALSKNNLGELAQWVNEQHKTLASKNKNKEKAENDIKMPSTLPEIFTLWHQRLGSPANKEEGPSNQLAKDC